MLAVVWWRIARYRPSLRSNTRRWSMSRKCRIRKVRFRSPVPFHCLWGTREQRGPGVPRELPDLRWGRFSQSRHTVSLDVCVCTCVRVCVCVRMHAEAQKFHQRSLTKSKFTFFPGSSRPSRLAWSGGITRLSGKCAVHLQQYISTLKSLHAMISTLSRRHWKFSASRVR